MLCGLLWVLTGSCMCLPGTDPGSLWGGSCSGALLLSSAQIIFLPPQCERHFLPVSLQCEYHFLLGIRRQAQYLSPSRSFLHGLSLHGNSPAPTYSASSLPAWGGQAHSGPSVSVWKGIIWTVRRLENPWLGHGRDSAICLSLNALWFRFISALHGLRLLWKQLDLSLVENGPESCSLLWFYEGKAASLPWARSSRSGALLPHPPPWDRPARQVSLWDSAGIEARLADLTWAMTCLWAGQWSHWAFYFVFCFASLSKNPRALLQPLGSFPLAREEGRLFLSWVHDHLESRKEKGWREVAGELLQRSEAGLPSRTVSVPGPSSRRAYRMTLFWAGQGGG